MRYATVCSGIEAATVAWAPLGWEAAWFSEIEPFPCSVLAHHYPDVPNLGDMTRIQDHEVFRGAAIDLLAGGTPCQSFSVAGLRKGLADPRGNLALHFLALADAARPRWVVWENVPGVLSSNDGRDFGAFLGALGELGYGWAYRILDAQYFGVAQRRRRVFVVGHAGGAWQRAAAVLFERHSLSGDPAPSRAPGEAAAGTLMACAGRQGWRSSADDAANGLLISHALTAHGQRLDGTVETLIPFDTTQITSAKNRSNPRPGDPCHTLLACGAPAAVAFNAQDGGTQTTLGFDPDSGITGALVANQVTAVLEGGPRRLTPREYERLQGFPDDYTLVPHRGKPSADGPRYKALGNTWATVAPRWFGERIAAVDAITP